MLVVRDWLKDYLGKNTPSAEAIEELLTFHAFEIEGVKKDGKAEVIDVDVLPNRSSDCLCHRGIARELATLLDVGLELDPLRNTDQLNQIENIEVHIEDPTLCPRFTAALVKDIKINESPQWLKERLTAIGQRPINNVVDATNYVMFAIGQPIHAYDADLFPQVAGQWHFGVRLAKPGEVVSLIAEGGKDGDRDIKLNGSELLIVDNSSNTPIGLAGVKGGRFAGVHEGTKNIIIEAAHFNPIQTRKTARALGIVIDASKRFENEPSRELPPYAQNEVTKLITQIAGGACEGMLDVYLEKVKQPTVQVRPQRVNELLGLSLSIDDMENILRRLGATVEHDNGIISATGPFERTDLTIEENYVEEIGRIYGYDHVSSEKPLSVPLSEINARHYYCDVIRDALVEQGFSEIITSSFRKQDQVQLANALASDKSCLRSTLTPNLAAALVKNSKFADLLGVNDIRIFEIGTVFEKSGGTVTEHVSLALGVRSKLSGATPADDKKLSEAILALETKLDIKLKAEPRSGIAELNISQLLSELPDPPAYEPVTFADTMTYQPFSVFPFVSRDIAVWVPTGTTESELADTLKDHASELCVRITLFDQFAKEDRTSYAFRLVFQSPNRTLTDSDVNEIMETINKAVEEQGWEVR